MKDALSIRALHREDSWLPTSLRGARLDAWSATLEIAKVTTLPSIAAEGGQAGRPS